MAFQARMLVTATRSPSPSSCSSTLENIRRSYNVGLQNKNVYTSISAVCFPQGQQRHLSWTFGKIRGSCLSCSSAIHPEGPQQRSSQDRIESSKRNESLFFARMWNSNNVVMSQISPSHLRNSAYQTHSLRSCESSSTTKRHFTTKKKNKHENRKGGKRAVTKLETEKDDELDPRHLDLLTPPEASRYAVVRHGDAYEQQMEGYHGMTLQKAQREGKGKDDPLFDPFMEDELMEQQIMEAEEAESQEGETVDEEEDGDENAQDDELEDDEENYDDEEEEGEGGGTLSKEAMANMSKEELTRVLYNVDGSIRRKASQKQILRAGSPAGGVYAVVELAGSQFKVTHDDLLIVNRLNPYIFSVGSIHALPEVLLVGTTHFTLVGLPYVRGAKLHVMVEEITKDKKVIIFKKRRRKNSQRKRGFRRDITMLRILDITFPEEFPVDEDKDFVARIEPDLLPPRRDPNEKSFDDEDDDEEDLEEEVESPKAA